MMQTWTLHDLETVTDEEILAAPSILAVIFDDDDIEPVQIVPPSLNPGEPLYLVVGSHDGIERAKARVEKVRPTCVKANC